MTVAELIHKLQKHPPELRVVAEGYEEGYDNVVDVTEIKIQPAANPKWWVGAYDKTNDGTGECAVLINGKNKGKDIG